MSWTNETIQATVAAVIERAGKDDHFRSLCISDIRAAVKEVSGQEIPDGYRINIIDGAGYHVNIVLPEAKSSEDELSETELESVAGGSKAGAAEFFGDVDTVIRGVAEAHANPIGHFAKGL